MRTRNGPTVAAGVMRSLRALVNTAMRLDETIERNPVEAVRVGVPILLGAVAGAVLAWVGRALFGS